MSATELEKKVDEVLIGRPSTKSQLEVALDIVDEVQRARRQMGAELQDLARELASTDARLSTAIDTLAFVIGSDTSSGEEIGRAAKLGRALIERLP